MVRPGSGQSSAWAPQSMLFTERWQRLLCRKTCGVRLQHPRLSDVETQTNFIHLQEQKARKINLWFPFPSSCSPQARQLPSWCNLSPEMNALHTCCPLGFFCELMRLNKQGDTKTALLPCLSKQGSTAREVLLSRVTGLPSRVPHAAGAAGICISLLACTSEEDREGPDPHSLNSPHADRTQVGRTIEHGF